MSKILYKNITAWSLKNAFYEAIHNKNLFVIKSKSKVLRKASLNVIGLYSIAYNDLNDLKKEINYNIKDEIQAQKDYKKLGKKLGKINPSIAAEVIEIRNDEKYHEEKLKIIKKEL
jgi:rubrerythrin